MPVSYWRSRYFRVYAIAALVYWVASILAILLIIGIGVMIGLAHMDYMTFINVTGPFTVGNLVFIAPLFSIICIIFGYMGFRNRMALQAKNTGGSKEEAKLNIWASIVELQKTDYSAWLSAIRSQIMTRPMIAMAAYIIASVFAFIGVLFLALVLQDLSSPVNTMLGPLFTLNLFGVCPWVFIIMILIGFARWKNIRAQRKETGASADAERTAQRPKGPLAGATPEPYNAGIKKAEENLDIWTLIVQLKGQNSGDRISAARGLRCYNTPEVEEELTRVMLEDDDVNVRFEAYLALKFQGKDKMGLLLKKLKAAGDTGEKLSILELLRKTGDASQTGTLIYLYDFETDKSVRLGILDSLSKFYHFDIRDMAISVLSKEEDKDIRLKAMEALRWYEDSNTQDIMERLRRDPDTDIRNSADRALKSIELRI